MKIYQFRGVAKRKTRAKTRTLRFSDDSPSAADRVTRDARGCFVYRCVSESGWMTAKMTNDRETQSRHLAPCMRRTLWRAFRE